MTEILTNDSEGLHNSAESSGSRRVTRPAPDREWSIDRRGILFTGVTFRWTCEGSGSAEYNIDTPNVHNAPFRIVAGANLPKNATIMCAYVKSIYTYVFEFFFC